MPYYKILEGTTQDVERDVNRLLQDGWTPLGGVSSKGTYCIQAMIR